MRRVPRRLTFDSEPATVHDLLALEPAGAGAPPAPAGGAGRGLPLRPARRWASFLVPVAVVAAGLASLPSTPPGMVRQATAAEELAAPTLRPPAAVPVAASGDATEPAAIPHGVAALAAAPSAGPESVAQSAPTVSAPVQDKPSLAAHALLGASDPMPAIAALGAEALSAVSSAPAPGSQTTGSDSRRTEPALDGSAARASARGAGMAASASRSGPRQGLLSAVPNVRLSQTGSGRLMAGASEPAGLRRSVPRPVRASWVISSGLSLVQARQCGHLGALPRGFCEQRVQLAYCTGRYGRSGDCPLPTIAMPN